MTTTDNNISFTDDYSIQCKLDQRPFRKLVLFLGLMVVSIEIFLCVSLLVNRKKLIHKVVNAYAVNAVVNHFLSSLSHVINSFYGFVGGSPLKYNTSYSYIEEEKFEMYAWLFMKSLQGTYVLALSFSLALLINAVQGDLFRIHRTVSGASDIASSEKFEIQRNSGNKLKRSRGKFSRFDKKKKATCLIIFNCCMPVVMAFISFCDVKCLRSCKCPYHYYIPTSNSSRPCPSSRSDHRPSDDCHAAWAPISNNMSIPFAIVCLFMLVVDILLLIHSFKKFSEVVKDHKKTSKPNCKFRKKKTTPILLGYTKETRPMLRESNSNRESNPEVAKCVKTSTLVMTLSNDVGQVEKSTVTGSSNEINLKGIDDGSCEENSGRNNNSSSDDVELENVRLDDTRLDDVKLDEARLDVEVDDGKNKQAIVSSPDVIYEVVTFSNLFLLARLKKNLMFLSLILLTFCIGYGGVMIYTLVLCYYPHLLQYYVQSTLIVTIPAILSDGLISIMLCCTTADLKKAVLHPIQKAFLICRKVETN